MSEVFCRILRLPLYLFAHIDPIKAKAGAEGVDIIDLGMGNPDMPTPEHIVAKLQETVKDGRTHRYSTSRGIPGLRKAQASYYGRRFGVKLNPDTQVVATLGSKEGFANMASAITAPGDVVSEDISQGQETCRLRSLLHGLEQCSPAIAWRPLVRQP